MALTFDVKEGGLSVLTATLRDAAGVAIEPGQLTALTLTVFDELTGTIIHARDHQNVLNANGVTVAAGGILTWRMGALDKTLVDDSRAFEVHLALFEWTYGSDGADSDTVRIRVANVRLLPP